VIPTYFAQIKALVDQYAATRFVLDAQVSFEERPGAQGYLAGSITFVDRSALSFREFLDVAGETVDKLMYTYHYRDAGDELIFRYDNARHRPPTQSREHKHIAPGQVVEAVVPSLESVLAEITSSRGWV
jgi:hypothetical protein